MTEPDQWKILQKIFNSSAMFCMAAIPHSPIKRYTWGKIHIYISTVNSNTWLWQWDYCSGLRPCQPAHPVCSHKLLPKECILPSLFQYWKHFYTAIITPVLDHFYITFITQTLATFVNCIHYPNTAVQLVFNPFSQFVPQLELYSQLQLSLWSDPIAFSVSKSTWLSLVKIQGDRSLADTQMKKWWKFEHFLTSRIKWKVTL